jgi:hypothetical protein
MEQLWELMGRASLDNDLLQQLHASCVKGPAVFTAFVNGRTAEGGLGYRLARAEMADIYNLSSHPLVPERGAMFRVNLRQALMSANVAESGSYSVQADLREFRTFLGMLFIDDRVHNAVFEAVGAAGPFSPGDAQAGAAAIEDIAGSHIFSPGRQPCEALYRLLKNAAYDARGEMHLVHEKWTPPDCYSAKTFSDKFQESDVGGVRRSDKAPPFGVPRQAASTGN